MPSTLSSRLWFVVWFLLLVMDWAHQLLQDSTSLTCLPQHKIQSPKIRTVKFPDNT
ncbi:hypothetical protein I79_005615 [Cricetulus griseus]|uniref:Uncharacterized protein n=1 Tax=Cricetulus griseus TaxID=10029 RepID=G3H5M9_CRIGR|nr:hypothetical protein I79_005615 [Cricetulus griseus]